MNVHKFRAKLEISRAKTIHWRLSPNLKYPPIKVNPVTWKIFSQDEITLAPRQVFPMQLGLGFMMTKGVVLNSLAFSLRFKNCSLQNEISLEDVDNILITITNNSKKNKRKQAFMSRLLSSLKNITLIKKWK